MKIEAEHNCPLDNFNPCRKLGCAWFMKLAGTNPNTGEAIEDWGCAMAWLPFLVIENSNQQRSTAVAVESFRNEMVDANRATQQVLLATTLQNSNLLEVKQ